VEAIVENGEADDLNNPCFNINSLFIDFTFSARYAPMRLQIVVLSWQLPALDWLLKKG
jgi:hypothetical protein